MYNILFRLSIFVLIALSAVFAHAADFKIGRYATTPEAGWNANGYWLEGEEGIVLIDALMLIEDASRWAALLKSIDKPVKGLIVTHYHHDHIGGINTLLKELGPFPIYSGKGTADTHVEANEFSLAFTKEKYGDRFDTTLIAPTIAIEGKREVEIAGIPLIIEDIGPGESLSATIIYQPDQEILFSGDTTVHNTQSYTTESRSTQMIEQLVHIKKNYPNVKTIYSGHGDPAGLSHVDFQISYIQMMQKIAKETISTGNYRHADSGQFNIEVINQRSEIISEKFPELSSYGFPSLPLITQNLIGVIQEFEK